MMREIRTVIMFINPKSNAKIQTFRVSNKTRTHQHWL